MKNLLFFLLLISQISAFAQTDISTAKPWAYWWWLGSAVNKNDVRRNLADFQRAAFGGLHIISM
jgi:hypothetical protein